MNPSGSQIRLGFYSGRVNDSQDSKPGLSTAESVLQEFAEVASSDGSLGIGAPQHWGSKQLNVGFACILKAPKLEVFVCLQY